MTKHKFLFIVSIDIPHSATKIRRRLSHRWFFALLGNKNSETFPFLCLVSAEMTGVDTVSLPLNQRVSVYACHQRVLVTSQNGSSFLLDIGPVLNRTYAPR